jgi:stress response protein SCP2
MVGKPNVRVSPTHNNLTGRESTSTGPKAPQVTATQDKSGNVNVNVQMNMRNPEQQVLGHGVGQGIRSDVNISVDQKATYAQVQGLVSKSPAFEANITPQGRATTNVPLQSASQNPVQFAIDLQKSSQIDVRVDLPPLNPR